MPNPKRPKLSPAYDGYRARGGNRYLPPWFLKRCSKIRVAKFSDRAFVVSLARAACPALTDKGIEELVLEPLAEILGFPPEWARSSQWWDERRRQKAAAHAAWQEKERREYERSFISLNQIQKHNAEWDSRRAEPHGEYQRCDTDTWATVDRRKYFGTPRGRIYQDNYYPGHSAAEWRDYHLRGWWREQAKSKPPEPPEPPEPAKPAKRLVRGRPPKADKLSRKEIQRNYRLRKKGMAHERTESERGS